MKKNVKTFWTLKYKIAISDMNSMLIILLLETYRLNQIVVYPLTPLPAHSKDFLRELPKSLPKNI